MLGKSRDREIRSAVGDARWKTLESAVCDRRQEDSDRYAGSHPASDREPDAGPGDPFRRGGRADGDPDAAAAAATAGGAAADVVPAAGRRSAARQDPRRSLLAHAEARR